MTITATYCSYCGSDLCDSFGTRRIAIVDPDRDYVVAYRCPVCLAEEPSSLADKEGPRRK